MAIYRTVHMSFWTDPKVDDDFTPEDKYFYLYLLTNPHTNICGCYEISMKQMVRETGYNEDTIRRLLSRMEFTHNVIQYDKDTKEVYIPKWGKYNWCNSQKTMDGAASVVRNIKSNRFRKALSDTLSIGYQYPMDTSVTVTDTDTVSGSVSKRSRFVPPTLEQVKAYAKEANLNIDCEKFYKYFTVPNPDTGKTWVDSKGNPVRNWKQKMLTWERRESKMNSKQQDYYDKWHPKCERGGSVAQIEDIELKLEDLE